MIVVGLVLAAACAVQGTWSPCGLSMLSTITPLGEHSRHHSYAWSAWWYVAGAAVGGACLGSALLLAATAYDQLPGATSAAPLILSIGVIVCLAGDARIGGFHLPDFPRQVDERWVERMRPWAYSAGFGWQIGTGVATYLMTNGIYALILLGIVSLPPLDALSLGVAFGTCRGMGLLVGARSKTPEQLRRLHLRLDRLAPWSIAIPAVAEVLVLVVLVARSASPLAQAVGAGVAGALVVAVARRMRRPERATVGL